MTDTANNLVGVALAESRADAPAPRPARQPPQITAAPPGSPERSVYLNAARELLPHWLRIIGPAPWFYGGVERDSPGRASASALYRQQAATLAIGVLSEVDRQRPDRAWCRECVRTSLIRWQLSLRGDGRPAGRRLRRSPLRAAIVAQVVHLLSETAGFQTDMLLDDIARHLWYLARRPPRAPWLEAALICAMADGAVLVRDSGLLNQAKHRLEILLLRQDEEGWFPERGGADVGRLSLTVDALARVYRQIGWEKLKEPLGRALTFLTDFVRADGGTGGCYNTCDTAFVSPYGVELLSSSFPEAAALALACRRRYATPAPDRLFDGADDLYAVLGASVMLSAVAAEPRIPEGYDHPSERTGHTRFPRAGLAVFATRSYHAIVSGQKSGAVHVVWHNGAPDLEDAGVIVVYAHGVRAAGGSGTRSRCRMTASSVTCSGILRRAMPARNRLLRRFGRLGSWIRGETGPPQTSLKADRTPRIDCRQLAHDCYMRRITFEEDSVRIHDHIHCRLPCEAIALQSPTLAPMRLFGHAASPGRTTRPPIFANGGRNVGITRVYRDGELIDQRRD